MMDRDWRQLRSIIEKSFIDDLCHLFEESEDDPLYSDMTDAVTEITEGLQNIQDISSICEHSVFTSYLPGVAVFGFVVFLAEVLVSDDSYKSLAGEVYEPRSLQPYLQEFCKQAYFGLTNGRTVVCYKDRSLVMDEMDTLGFCVARVGHRSALLTQIAIAIDSLRSLMPSELQGPIYKSVVTLMMQGTNQKDSMRNYLMKTLPLLSGRAEISTPQFVDLAHCGLIVVKLLQKETLPSAGILGVSKFGKADFQNSDSDGGKSFLPDETRYADLTRQAFDTLKNMEKGILPDTSSLRFEHAHSLGTFLSKCVEMALKVAEAYTEFDEDDSISFEDYKSYLLRVYCLGVIGRDIQGWVTTLYEDLIFKEVIACFNRNTGERVNRTRRAAQRSQRGAD